MTQEIEIDENAQNLGPLPAGFEDDRDGDLSPLNQAVERELGFGGNTKTTKTRRQNWARVWPILRLAGITNAAQLDDPAEWRHMVDALNVAARLHDPQVLGGTPGTLLQRLTILKWGLKVGEPSEAVKSRLKSMCTEVLRSSGFEAEHVPPLTLEEADRIRELIDEGIEQSEDVRRVGYRYEGMVEWGPKKRRLAPKVIRRLKCWVAVILTFNMRANAAWRIRTGDCTSDGIRWTLKKGQPLLKPVNRSMPADAWGRIAPWVEERLAEAGPDSVLFTGDMHRQMRDVRALMLEAGVVEHNGRVGLHRARHLAAKIATEADMSCDDVAAALCNRPTTVWEHYLNPATKDARANLVHEKVAHLLAKDRSAGPTDVMLLEFTHWADRGEEAREAWIDHAAEFSRGESEPVEVWGGPEVEVHEPALLPAPTDAEIAGMQRGWNASAFRLDLGLELDDGMKATEIITRHVQGWADDSGWRDDLDPYLLPVGQPGYLSRLILVQDAERPDDPAASRWMVQVVQPDGSGILIHATSVGYDGTDLGDIVAKWARPDLNWGLKLPKLRA